MNAPVMVSSGKITVQVLKDRLIARIIVDPLNTSADIIRERMLNDWPDLYQMPFNMLHRAAMNFYWDLKKETENANDTRESPENDMERYCGTNT